MVTKSGISVLGVITLVGLAGVDGARGAESRCTSAKYKAIGTRATAGSRCFAEAAVAGGSANPACLTSAEEKIRTRFAEAEETGDCLTDGDVGSIEFRVSALVGDLVQLVSGSAVDPFLASKCDSKKIRAAGSRVAAGARCMAKAARKGIGVDPDCLGMAGAKFGKAVDRAELRPDCHGTGHEAILGSEIDAFISDITGALEAAPCGTFLGNWGSAGSGDGQFNHPTGVAVDARGDVYVADSRNHRIQKFTSGGSFLTQWGSFGSGEGQFNLPIGLRVDGSGNVFVVDTLNSRVQKFTSAGAFIAQWGVDGSGDGQFNFPLGLGVDGSGNVYVADTDNHRIQKFTNAGSFLTQWDSTGTGVVPFDPTDVAVDGSGDVYVTDQSNRHVQTFTSMGTFLTQWGSFGSGEGQFDRAVGIVVDPNRNVFVGDRENNNVQKFTSTGMFLARWGVTGSGDGEFSTPLGVGVDGSGIVFVADSAEVFDDVVPNNNRIQKFACP